MGESENKGQKINVINKLDEIKFEHFVILSPFLIAEISAHFADWYLLNKVIKSGHSYREFASEKKNHFLDENEKYRLNEIIEKISAKRFVNTITVNEIKRPNLDLLFTLVNNQVDFFDALHIMTAESTDCKYFITKDKELRIRTQPLINKGAVSKELKLISPNNFIKLSDIK
ncbi:Uncharacterised protein [uncultured archaeon]|nr:Uncharacterised protein [uncultured archaeon]